MIGALAAPAAVSGAAKAASAIAPSLEDVGMGLQRKAMGARASDYKLAKNAIIETVEGDTTTQLKKSFDNLIEKGTLGKSIDPESMYPKLQAAKEAAEDSIQSVLKGTEAKVGPVPPPSFDKTLEYVSKNIAANDVDKYLNEVISLQDALRREGKGSLVYLNQQKKIIGENWKNSPQSDPGFWRNLYRDMKGHIEKYAPEVKNLNKQKQDLIVVSPIIERGFKASGASYDIGKAMQLLYTSGGAGLAGGAILGAATGDTEAGILGALTLRALATPKGQNLVGKLTTNLSKAIPKEVAAVSLGDLATIAGKAAPKDLQASATEPAAMPETGDWLNEAESLFVEPTPAPAKESVKVGKQNISIPTGKEFAPPSLVRAVMKAESAGKQEAISPKGARGLMQLMPGTAKDLGVNPDDPQENVEGGSKLLRRLLNKYDSREIALAAYNWGPGNIDKAIRKVRAAGKEVTWQSVLDEVKVPKETRNYVSKVINLEKRKPEEESLLRTVASLAPITGEIISAQDTIESLRQGEYRGALINALGVIPAAGIFSRLRKANKVVDAVDKITQAKKTVEKGSKLVTTEKANEISAIAKEILTEQKAAKATVFSNKLKRLNEDKKFVETMIEKEQKRAGRKFNQIGSSYDDAKQKQSLKQTTNQLDADKTRLAKIEKQIEETKNELKKLFGIELIK